MKKLIFLLPIILLTAVRCPLAECTGKSLAILYVEKVNLTSEKAAYTLGDTLWLNSAFSCRSIFDSVARQKVAFCDFSDLQLRFSISTFSNNGYIDAGKNFNNVGILGNVVNETSNNAQVKMATFRKTGDSLTLRIGFVPTQKGIFELKSNYGSFKKAQLELDECESYAFNFDIYPKNRNVDLSPGPIPEHLTSRVYYFKVE